MNKFFKPFFSVGIPLLFLALPLHAELFNHNPESLSTLIGAHSAPAYLGLFFILGLFLAFTPCVLPMVPILSGIIARHGNPNAKTNLQLASCFVAGMAITYACAGVLAALFGESLQTLMQTPWVVLGFSLLIAALSLSLFDVFKLNFSSPHRTARQKTSANKYLNVFLMGVFSTLIVSPCVTAPLIGVLLFISQSGQLFLGGSVLFVMALGMGIPLLLFSAGFGAFLPKSGPWMMIVKTGFGYMLLAMSLWLAARVIPDNLTYLLTLLLILLFTFHLGVHLNQLTKKWQKLTLLLITLLTGFGLSVYTLGNSQDHASPSLSADNLFSVIDNTEALKTALAEAQKKQQPVFVEFYASWCGDCKAMDKQVFNSDAVRAALEPFVRIRVDLTYSTPTTRRFKEDYHIFGTPTLMFINKDGKEQTNLTAAGFLNQTEFLALIDKASKE